MADIPALPTHLTLEIVTPDRSITREQVDEVEIPGVEGYFGVLPGHTPLLAMLGVGELWYRQGQEKTYLAIAFGFAEVLPDRVTILAQLAERAEDIDVRRAEAARDQAQAVLAKPTRETDLEEPRIALLKATTRLQVASRARTRA